MREPVELTYAECVELLNAGVVGRVAVTTPDGPYIVPVNYAVVDDAIIFRTTPYSVLGSYARSAEIAFEVDHLDYDTHGGWSVLARGRAEIIVDADELHRIREAWGPRPWAAGTRGLHVRLPWRELTGRRIGSASTTTEDLPVRRYVPTA